MNDTINDFQPVPVSDLIDLTGKVALVTGAARGFGFACASRMAEAGAAVVLADRRQALCQQSTQKLLDKGYGAHAVAVDITREDDVERAVLAAIDQFGRLDILINSAGVFTNYLLEAMSVEEFRRVVDINVTGSFLTIQAAARVMREQGRGGAIINISSIDAIRPSAPGLSHYDASKHAVWGMTKSAAIELGPDGIRVNAIAPGSSFTEGVEEFLQTGAPAGHDIQAQFDAIAARTPLKRTCTPDEVAKVALFLASDLASFVNGTQVVVDGGFLLC